MVGGTLTVGARDAIVVDVTVAGDAIAREPLAVTERRRGGWSNDGEAAIINGA